MQPRTSLILDGIIVIPPPTDDCREMEKFCINVSWKATSPGILGPQSLFIFVLPTAESSLPVLLPEASHNQVYFGYLTVFLKTSTLKMYVTEYIFVPSAS